MRHKLAANHDTAEAETAKLVVVVVLSELH